MRTCDWTKQVSMVGVCDRQAAPIRLQLEVSEVDDSQLVGGMGGRR